MCVNTRVWPASALCVGDGVASLSVTAGAAGTHRGAAIGLVNSEVLPARSVTVKIMNGLQLARLMLLKLPELVKLPR